MESPLTMTWHGGVIGIILYLIMAFGLKQPENTAIARSVLFGSLTIAYMTAFGHGLPTTINPDLL